MLKNFLKTAKRLLQPKASSFDKYIRTPLPIQEDLLKYFSRNSRLVVFDIGSCEGEDSIRYAKLFPHATIYSFEPLENNYNKILSNIRKEQCTGIQPYKLALSDEKGVAQFYVSSGHPPHKPNTSQWDYGNKSSSLLKPGKIRQTHAWLEFKSTAIVATDTVFNFCKAKGLSAIDFIHLDVQGAELMVLKGSGDLIDNVKLIWLEVESIQLYKKQPLTNDIESFMYDHAFVLLKDTVDDVSGDRLYANSKLLGS